MKFVPLLVVCLLCATSCYADKLYHIREVMEGDGALNVDNVTLLGQNFSDNETAAAVGFESRDIARSKTHFAFAGERGLIVWQHRNNDSLDQDVRDRCVDRAKNVRFVDFTGSGNLVYVLASKPDKNGNSTFAIKSCVIGGKSRVLVKIGVPARGAGIRVIGENAYFVTTKKKNKGLFTNTIYVVNLISHKTTSFVTFDQTFRATAVDTGWRKMLFVAGVNASDGNYEVYMVDPATRESFAMWRTKIQDQLVYPSAIAMHKGSDMFVCYLTFHRVGTYPVRFDRIINWEPMLTETKTDANIGRCLRCY